MAASDDTGGWMKNKGLGHLALAKKIADETGRHISECMGEAADQIIRERSAARVPGLRFTYLLLAIVFAILSLSGLCDVAGIWMDTREGWFGVSTMGIGLAGIFWIAPELPLLSIFWSRWNTPLFIALMVLSLFLDPHLSGTTIGAAKTSYFGIAFLSAVKGLKDPYLALDRRICTSRLFFRKLSQRDQARVFFLAPWLDPFHFRAPR